jgi:hypothetical protein
MGVEITGDNSWPKRKYDPPAMKCTKLAFIDTLE